LVLWYLIYEFLSTLLRSGSVHWILIKLEVSPSDCVYFPSNLQLNVSIWSRWIWKVNHELNGVTNMKEAFTNIQLPVIMSLPWFKVSISCYIEALLTLLVLGCYIKHLFQLLQLNIHTAWEVWSKLVSIWCSDWLLKTGFITRQIFVAVMLRNCIRGIPSLNLNWCTSYTDQCLLGFYHSLEMNANKHFKWIMKSLPIQHSWLSFHNVPCYVSSAVERASLNTRSKLFKW
jgi:hypothetical protein